MSQGGGSICGYRFIVLCNRHEDHESSLQLKMTNRYGILVSSREYSMQSVGTN